MSDEIIIQEIDISCLDRVSSIHLKAFPSSTFTRVGYETVRRYYSWQFAGPHDLITLGAFKGEELVGYLIGGKFRGALIGFLRKNWRFLIFQVLYRPWLLLSQELREPILDGGMYLLSKIRRSPETRISGGPNLNDGGNQKAGILAIATDPELQRLGIGHLMMLRFEVDAAGLGYQELGLTVSIENQAAIRFYQGLGWEISAENDDSCRMTKEIGINAKDVF